MNETLANVLEFVRRWPYCVASGLLTVILGAGAWYLRGEIHNLEAIHRSRAEEGEAMLSKLVGGSTLRQELVDVRVTTRRIEENLVVESNLAENLWYFYKIQEQTKAELPDLHQANSPLGDKSTLYRRVPYSLRVLGTFGQVASFLLALETGPRLVKITAFNFARTDPTGQTVALELNVELLGKK